MLDESPSALEPTQSLSDSVQPDGKFDRFNIWACVYGLFDWVVVAAPAFAGM